MFNELTYEETREISIWAWEQRVKGIEIGSQELYDEFGKYFYNECGLCHYFLVILDENDCQSCPLRWNGAKVENNSDYDSGMYPCTRSFWHWHYWWELQYNIKRKIKYSNAEYHNIRKNMLRWARKVLEELKNMPKHL